MNNKINEKNFSFKTELPESEIKAIKSDEKVKIINQSNIEFVTDEEIEKKKNTIKIIDKIFLIINVATNIALIFFMGDMLSGFNYATGLGYSFTTTRYIGLAIFLLAQITGIYLTIKFFLKQNLKVRLLLVSVPLTFILVAGIWVFYNLNNISINDELLASDIIGLGESITFNIQFEYIIIAIAVYIILLYLLYGLIFKQSKASKVSKRKA